jgi:hypothetical protein
MTNIKKTTDIDMGMERRIVLWDLQLFLKRECKRGSITVTED